MKTVSSHSKISYSALPAMTAGGVAIDLAEAVELPAPQFTEKERCGNHAIKLATAGNFR